MSGSPAADNLRVGGFVDISPAGSVAQAQALVQGQVAVSVLKKSLDLSAEQGAELAKIMASAGGVGQRVDQYA